MNSLVLLTPMLLGSLGALMVVSWVAGLRRRWLIIGAGYLSTAVSLSVLLYVASIVTT